jgi:hypothetical protein
MRMLKVLLPALALLGCSSGSVERAEGAWGKVEGSLQAALDSPRAVVRLGEAIELRVRVRNATGELCHLASSHDLVLRVSRGDKAAGDDRDYVALAPEAMELPPGQERAFPLRQYATDGAGATLCKGPGIYKFQGKLGNLELPPVQVRVE